MMDLFATAEALRVIQAQCNAYDLPLASSSGAWGHLHSAILDLLAEWFVTAQGAPEEEARRMAERVLDEVYDNGEDLAYNMRLLAEGQIEVYA